MTRDEILNDLMFDTSNEREYLIAKIAMMKYAKEKVEEQRRLLHKAINSRCSFDDESEQSNFVIEVMNSANYPDFIN